MMRTANLLISVAALSMLPMACTPADGGDPQTEGATISFEVSTPAGASEVWALLFSEDSRRSVVLEADPATAVAKGSITDLPAGEWQVFVLSGPDADSEIVAAHESATVNVMAGDAKSVAVALRPLAVSTYQDLTFNPAGPVFAGTGALNPFALPRVREAMNRLLDREAIAALVPVGSGPAAAVVRPRFTSASIASADYRDLVGFFEGVERAYAPDAVAAHETIAQEMQGLGAQWVDGVWHHDGKPVTITVLIRNDDFRLDIGDYAADRLEEAGFLTRRTYASATDARPIWDSVPDDGLWHVYTGGWLTNAVGRPTDGDYRFFFTPDGIGDSPLWAAYTPTAEFYDLAVRLDEGDYAAETERLALVREAVTHSMQDSVRVFLTQVFWAD